MIALILGGAVCVWDDLEAFRRLYAGPVTTIAINETGHLYPGGLDYWISLHPENWTRKAWLDKRPADGYQLVSHRTPKGVPVRVVTEHWGPGSSGLYAAKFAKVDLGLRAVLCGVPIDTQGNVDGRPDWAMKEVNVHREGWKKHAAELRGHVTSMSGWTRDLLGAPTEDWLWTPRKA